ncbi:chemotaxis protein CheY [Mycobacterium sp. 21AC1]|uniref:chemotaxis protein CheY n=1 Tax=[Mycobacterium] appelbergii TaxID=2939269 RepID=UPI0029390462|nr:chemotaxis protein CheY [Mycobacterium sp. 21AC1]MDV3128030.1 chemotaxis protein CheY [Mycobacterium sp. 21AC1]
MDDRSELLAVARSAYQRKEWLTSYESFSRVDAVQPLDTEDLAVFAAAAWRQGHGSESVRINEQVHTRLLRTDPVLAAMKATELGLAWLARGHVSLARNWAQRAAVLLQGVPEASAHGYLTYLTAVTTADDGVDSALPAAAAEVARIAEHVDDVALAILARVLDGVAAVSADDAAGYRTLDDVLLPMLDERVPVEWAGDVYRRVLTLPQPRTDGARLRSWTQSMQQWCETTQPETPHAAYRAICDVHRLAAQQMVDRAELMRRGVDLRRLVAEVDAVATAMAEGLLARGMGRTG